MRTAAFRRVSGEQIVFRAGALDRREEVASSDDIRSGSPPSSYRYYPETDTFPPQRVLLGELLRLQICQRGPNDPACAVGIAQLRSSSATYEEDEQVRCWNPQLRTSERSWSTAAVGAPSRESTTYDGVPLAARSSTPVSEGVVHGERWLNDGIPNPLVCIELCRLVLVGEFPLPNRGVPRWLLYILNSEIYSPCSSKGAADIRNLMTFDEMHALMRREHRI